MKASPKTILHSLVALKIFSFAASTDIQDVIIVGAGWSGLAAGNYLMEAGITENFLILEARDRIGGRSWTIEDAFKPGHSVELGSGWIYPDTNIFDLVQKLGIEHETTRYAFDETFGLYNSTGELLGDDKSSLIDDVYLYDFVYYAEKMAGDDVSWTEIKESYFADNYDMSDSERQAINALVHAGITIEFGSPLNETNSESTQEYLSRGDWRDIEFMSIAGGTGGGYTGALTRGLAKSIEQKIKTGTPVTKIDYDGEVVEVYTTNGQVLYARTIIVTVPLGVLKKSSIEFVPSLSDEKLEAIDVIGMGNMNKVMMYWDNATQNVSWWPEGKADLQLITEQDSDTDDWTYFINDQSYSTNSGYHVLTSWCGGDACDRLEKNTNQETLDLIIRNLRNMFGNDVPIPRKYIVTRWGSDEFSGGAYSFDTVGFDLTDYRYTLSEPVGNVFFAGEATDTDGWFGTAVGAYTTGVKAASRIGDSGMLEMPRPNFQPVCKPIHGSCGGQFDEACCSGLSCVVDNRLAPMGSISRNSVSIIPTSMRRICLPAQRRKKRDENRVGGISASYRLTRSGRSGRPGP